jgi:hypothetical protein
MPLDYCAYSVGDEPLSAEMPTLRADAEIRARFGLGDRLGRGQQPWYLYATAGVDTSPRARGRLRRRFHVTDLPPACALALEQMDRYRILVNGRPAGALTGWWVDEDLQTVDVTDLLKTGPNEIVLEFDYSPDMELEDMYLVGRFGVRTLDAGPPAPGNVTLVGVPRTLTVGSWVGQGLDFYGGAVRYHLRLTRPGGRRRLRVSLPGVQCTAAAIRVGGRVFDLPWAPLAADITDAMAEGANDVAVEVFGGRKNILGPLHVPWGPWTGPGQFDPNHGEWTEAYHLTDHGLTAGVLIETLEPR